MAVSENRFTLFLPEGYDLIKLKPIISPFILYTPPIINGIKSIDFFSYTSKTSFRPNAIITNKEDDEVDCLVYINDIKIVDGLTILYISGGDILDENYKEGMCVKIYSYLTNRVYNDHIYGKYEKSDKNSYNFIPKFRLVNSYFSYISLNKNRFSNEINYIKVHRDNDILRLIYNEKPFFYLDKYEMKKISINCKSFTEELKILNMIKEECKDDDILKYILVDKYNAVFEEVARRLEDDEENKDIIEYIYKNIIKNMDIEFIIGAGLFDMGKEDESRLSILFKDMVSAVCGKRPKTHIRDLKSYIEKNKDDNSLYDRIIKTIESYNNKSSEKNINTVIHLLENLQIPNNTEIVILTDENKSILHDERIYMKEINSIKKEADIFLKNYEEYRNIIQKAKAEDIKEIKKDIDIYKVKIQEDIGKDKEDKEFSRYINEIYFLDYLETEINKIKEQIVKINKIINDFRVISVLYFEQLKNLIILHKLHKSNKLYLRE